MRRIILIGLLIFAVAGFSHPVFAKDDKNTGKVIVYYFHGSFRCYSCSVIEKNSRGAIEDNFQDPLAAGKLEFKAVNVEERDNRHFIKDYQLYTRALVLSLLKDGKEAKHKNLTKIWEYARNKQRFADYIKEEVSNFLKEAQ